MTSYSRIGVVTGANKGIGYAIVRQLALQYPKSPLNNGPLLIYLTARDSGRGEAAVKQITHEDEQLKSAKALSSDGGSTDIKFHALDITDSKSIQKFVEDLKKAHGDGIDFVINNAGIAMNGFNSEVVKTTIGCNYYSTMEACHAFLPILKPQGRIVNVASMSGYLNKYSEEVRNRFLSSETEDDVSSILKDFASAVDAGKEKEAGFPSAAYAVSKAGLIGGTRALARQEKEKGSAVLINSCCPGYVNTDMTKGNGTLSPDEGAQTPVMLALQDLKGQTGLFWKDLKVKNWTGDA
ncbi:carbonyl reductase [Sporormia fimetaria CBS 119925]|uniref:Carbonyl reductase n=1 Tax=Sporormia fimetaria CBS 119925 TaxID=1340428 RepID=A0A6A6VEI7_9PLEO|nr:carbonyl reductase [Sporormia fimetaria CBS 119925]